MKKSIVSLSLLATLMFGAEYTEGLGILVNDVKTLNSYGMNSLDEMTQSQDKLNSYESKLNAYTDEFAKFSEQQAESFSSKKEALQAMEDLEELSSQSVVMAKELAYLTSHQADNMSDDYKSTLETVSQTTLRLSDDIGTMSDRILVMADKIGVMADRIVETQKIQSRNLQATTQLLHNVNRSSSDVAVQETASMSSAMQNNSMQQSSQNQNMSGAQR